MRDFNQLCQAGIDLADDRIQVRASHKVLGAQRAARAESEAHSQEEEEEAGCTATHLKS